MTRADYPRFDARVFPESPEIAKLVAGLPSAGRALFERGIPETLLGGIYHADPDLTVLARDERAPVLRFGTSGLSQAIGIDLATGEVVGVVDVPSRPTILVNATADTFTSTVQAMIGRFPYYAKDTGYEEIDKVAEELREIIRSIDEKAAVPGCYWPAFADDVQMGGFNTDEVLYWEDAMNEPDPPSRNLCAGPVAGRHYSIVVSELPEGIFQEMVDRGLVSVEKVVICHEHGTTC